MKFKLALSTATALGLLMGGALAADNQAYTDQDGERNIIEIQQNNGPGGNRVGTAANPILQDGNDNDFREQQQNGGGHYNMMNNVIEAGLQEGNNNTFKSIYNGQSSGGNLIIDILQDGNNNNAKVFRNSGSASTVGDLHQTGDRNWLTITQQGGSGNVVTKATQDGSDNGIGDGNRWNRGTQIFQQGTDNKVDEASIKGSNNIAKHPNSNPLIPGGYAVLDIRQHGTGNGSVFAIARMTGSDGNQIVIEQTGDYNQFSVIQGQTESDTQNAARIKQDGDYNEALIEQQGSRNSARLTFDGDSNGISGMTGVAGTLVSANLASLTPGKAFQNSSSSLVGNSITYDVIGSSNKFAFAQIGGNNQITGLVGNDAPSNGNQAAVLQNGSNNVSQFTQNGGTNNLSVNQ